MPRIRRPKPDLSQELHRTTHSRRAAQANRNAILANYLKPHLQTKTQQNALAKSAHVPQKVVQNIVSNRLLTLEDFRKVLSAAPKLLTPNQVDQMNAELAEIPLPVTSRNGIEVAAHHQLPPAEKPTQPLRSVGATVDTGSAEPAELNEQSASLENQADNKRVAPKTDGTPVADQPVTPSNRGDHARRIAITARHLRPWLNEPAAQALFATEAGLLPKVITRLLRSRLIQEAQLIRVLQTASSWLPLDEYLHMLDEMAESSRGKPFGGRQSDSELYLELRDQAKQANQTASDLNQVQEDALDGSFTPIVVIRSEMEEPQVSESDIMSIDLDQETGSLSFEVDNIQAERRSAVGLALEQLVNFGLGRIDYLNLRLGHDGEIDIECGNIVSPVKD